MERIFKGEIKFIDPGYEGISAYRPAFQLAAVKVINSDGECSETMVHLKFAWSCQYLSQEIYEYFIAGDSEVGKVLNYMFRHPEKFTPKDAVSAINPVEKFDLSNE